MKKTNKIIAMILCFCFILGALVIPAVAEESKTAWFEIVTAKATDFKEDDPQTVLRLELEVKATGNEVTFDKLNRDCEIGIYDYFCWQIYNNLDFNASTEKSKIAVAKPVSYRNNKLTLEVFSKTGEAGAKMVDIQTNLKVPMVAEIEDGHLHFSRFLFDIPSGLLQESSTGVTSESIEVETLVDGVAVEVLKFPILFTSLINGIYSGNTGSAATALFFTLPLTLLMLPIEIIVLAARLGRIYKLYDLSISELLDIALKYVRYTLSAIV